ncbi:hypothetical protein LARV_02076 [Longilinea arvoryzae]|uniref:4-amino-4-deoxy-L-arabinose transferase n=1 Tax=Longilinea arvoryzae TaxID=360412 RepID=A0A0S7BKG9_9CHLR|nr:hypothetical protein [Longilinea arvoryzae]GAP14309.1 hypothetical protein LARV_02076 [Longilinea arvoryzae]
MLIILPIFVWILAVLFWLGGSEQDARSAIYPHSTGSAVILANICWGAYLAVISELLSLAHFLTTTGVGLSWGLAFILLSIFGFRSGFLKRGLRRMGVAWRCIQPGDYVLAGVLALLSGALLLILIVSPSGNNDSLQYHLARVVHWAQDASLQHYATGFVPQLYNPIWAEEVILHLRLLWGNDQLAGLVQWGAMLTSLVAVCEISSELGIKRHGRWIAVAFVFSLPMGVLQSVSTQNDYGVAFWLAAMAWLCVRALTRPLSVLEALMLGLAVGLGALTKGTFYPFALPFGVLFLYASLRWIWRQVDRKKAWRRTLLLFGIIGLSIIALNGGYWIRNLQSFGNPLGPSDWISNMTAGSMSVGKLFSSLIAQVAMNFSSPFDQINNPIIQTIRTRLGPIDPRMNNFSMIWGWNHEDTAGNPLHVIILALGLLILPFSWRKDPDRRLWGYLATVLGSFAMMALVVHLDAYGVRYQLPLFVLFSPLVGAALEFPRFEKATNSGDSFLSRRRWIYRTWQAVKLSLVFILILAALPWVLFNRSHPLIAMKEKVEPFSIPCKPILGCTGGSILFESPMNSLFANHYDLIRPYSQMTDDLQRLGCKDVGLRIDSHDPEYLFWWLLDAPQSGYRLESLYTNPDLERYIDPAFHPCAIICTICGDRTRLHGLSLAGEYSGVKLFAGPGFESDEGPNN